MTYMLASLSEGERQQIQAQVWEPEVEVMLDRIGILPGWSCLDLGCGSMGILGPLSERVGTRGKVVGVDSDESLLNLARAKADKEKRSGKAIGRGHLQVQREQRIQELRGLNRRNLEHSRCATSVNRLL